jgi:hypothetical protein
LYMFLLWLGARTICVPVEYGLADVEATVSRLRLLVQIALTRQWTSG